MSVYTIEGVSLDPADDGVHEPAEGVARWAENIQWNVRDEAGLGVVWHMGTMLRDPRLWHVVVALTLPDGRVYSTKVVAPGQGHFGPANAEFSVVDPYRRWRFSFLGGMVDVTEHQGAAGLVADDIHVPIEIDLDLTEAYPVWIPTGSADHDDWGRFHHEQTVRVDGVITVDGVEHLRLTGIGHRDHSIGPRDMGKLVGDFWGNGVFDSGWAFATMSGEYSDDQPTFQRAAVFDADGIRQATMVQWSGLDSACGDPREVAVELDVEGARMVIEGRIRSGMAFTMVDGAEFSMGTDFRNPDRYMLTNLFCDWTCDGEAGIGYLDRGALIGMLTKDRT
jgi:hypothetical protein